MNANFWQRMFWLWLLFWPGVMGAAVSDVDRDQEVVFFPAMGCRTADGKAWQIEIQGCIYELEPRRATLALIREALEFKEVRMTEAEKATFAARARLFLVDHERGKRIVVRLAGRNFTLNKSEANGHFRGAVRLEEKELGGKRALPFQALLEARDTRVLSGTVSLVDAKGMTVISDIDDTIKITNVGDRHATLRSTFLEPFEPVRGMPELYAAWEQRGAQFWYVSASPWQLYLPLSDFVRSNRFPAGPFYLKDFSWKDKTMLSLFADPEKYKPKLIEPLLRKFPQRQFVLVGDSGERDPEIYGALARKFPKQIAHIFIRDLAPKKTETDRYHAAFRDVAADAWTVFREPGEVLSEVSKLFSSSGDE